MHAAQPAFDRRAGLKTAADIIISPATAFERLRENPTWGWALVIAIVVGAIGTFAIIPSLQHATTTTMAAQLGASPQIKNLPADQQAARVQQIIGIQQLFIGFSWLFVPVVIGITALVQALVMLVSKSIGRGDRGYKHLFALAINVQLAGAVGSLLLAAIVLLRGPNSFASSQEVQSVLPNFGMLAPGGPKVLVAFLTGINIIALWQIVLLALGMTGVARISRGVAWATVIVFVLVLAGLGAYGAAVTPSS